VGSNFLIRPHYFSKHGGLPMTYGRLVNNVDILSTRLYLSQLKSRRAFKQREALLLLTHKNEHIMRSRIFDYCGLIMASCLQMSALIYVEQLLT
jgi:hypothetical protein